MMTAAELRREFERGGAQDIADGLKIFIGNLAHSAAHADGCDDLAARREDRRGQTAHARRMLFIINRVTPATRLR